MAVYVQIHVYMAVSGCNETWSLQDTIKAEADHRPIKVSGANTEQRSNTGLHDTPLEEKN
ncbi:hypothetical protein EYF80_007131 [Liparis tanakae]|uniref:Uncharacterized protein n=1 Tax=Liparis tanakae TaxID=230148 RepID=A0A4Z2IZI4_9TELE|nr:hypothetical protein EYF80_007131 [Liparis tanakae]